MRTLAAYVAAALIGCAAPFLVLWLARKSSIGADPLLAAVGVDLALGVIAGLLAAAAARHWPWLALIVSLPLCLLGGVMFAAFADLGETYWIWLGVGLGGVAAALLGAFGAARLRRA